MEDKYHWYHKALEETLEKAVMFHTNASYCTKIDYLNNEDCKEYEVFFDSFLLSNNYAMISCLNKVIDRGGFSIFKYIEFLRCNATLFGNDKRETLKKLGVISKNIELHHETICKLIKHRNKFHAHLDKKIAREGSIYDVFFEQKVTEIELEALLEALCKAFIDITFIFEDALANRYIENFASDKNILYEFIEVEKTFDKIISKQ